jgi:hypothetical protein
MARPVQAIYHADILQIDSCHENSFLSDPGKKREKTRTGGKTATSPVIFGQPGISDNGLIRCTRILFTPKTRASL